MNEVAPLTHIQTAFTMHNKDFSCESVHHRRAEAAARSFTAPTSRTA